MGSLIIAFCSPGKKPLSVATIEDPELLRIAARLAIRQAHERAANVAGSDPVMALLQGAEVMRLRTALEVLVPGLNDPTPDCSDARLNVM
jgi:hypothetical protein